MKKILLATAATVALLMTAPADAKTDTHSHYGWTPSLDSYWV